MNALENAIQLAQKTPAAWGIKQLQSAGRNAVSSLSKWASPPALSPIPEKTAQNLRQPGGIKQAVNNIAAYATFQPQLVRPFVPVQAAAPVVPSPTKAPVPTAKPNAFVNALQTFIQQASSSATPTPAPPTPTARPKGPSPTPAPIRIAIPASSGTGETVVPQDIANAIFTAFDPYGEATNAAQVLHHPMQISGTPGEIQQGFNHWGNIGENPSFRPDAINVNRNKSLDTGLFQINSDTFNGMMANPYWRAALARRGITSYDQMTDPQKNALTAMLILMRGNFNAEEGTMRPNPSYIQWYGAPQSLRNR